MANFVFSGQYDQVILDLGTVTNSGADTVSDVASQVEILFNAILENNNATQYGTEDYSISAGVLYENSDSIWIGQFSFTATDDRSEWVSVFMRNSGYWLVLT